MSAAATGRTSLARSTRIRPPTPRRARAEQGGGGVAARDPARGTGASGRPGAADLVVETPGEHLAALSLPMKLDHIRSPPSPVSAVVERCPFRAPRPSR